MSRNPSSTGTHRAKVAVFFPRSVWHCGCSWGARRHTRQRRRDEGLKLTTAPPLGVSAQNFGNGMGMDDGGVWAAWVWGAAYPLRARTTLLLDEPGRLNVQLAGDEAARPRFHRHNCRRLHLPLQHVRRHRQGVQQAAGARVQVAGDEVQQPRRHADAGDLSDRRSRRE